MAAPPPCNNILREIDDGVMACLLALHVCNKLERT
jgi:hypothetical protein